MVEVTDGARVLVEKLAGGRTFPQQNGPDGVPDIEDVTPHHWAYVLEIEGPQSWDPDHTTRRQGWIQADQLWL